MKVAGAFSWAASGRFDRQGAIATMLITVPVPLAATGVPTSVNARVACAYENVDTVPALRLLT